MSPLGTSLQDPFFAAAEVPVLANADIVALAVGRLAAIHIRGMFGTGECAEVIRRLDEIPLDTYDRRRVDPPIARFGPAINDYRRDGRLSDEYWQHSTQAQQAWRGAGFEPDPMQTCFGHFINAWPGRAAPAQRGGREMFAGIVREINDGALVHYDDVTREYPHGVMDAPIIVQFAFNLYLSVPLAGGETTIWRRRWNPDDERHRKGYGYSSDLIGGYQSLQMRPETGDGILFDPRHFHAVAAGQGRRRIALAFFLGVTVAGELVFWS